MVSASSCTACLSSGLKPVGAGNPGVVWWEEHGKDGEYFVGKADLAGLDGPENRTVAEDELGEGLRGQLYGMLLANF